MSGRSLKDFGKTAIGILPGKEEGVNEDLKESKENVTGRQRKEDLVSWQMLQQMLQHGDLQNVFNELMDLAKEFGDRMLKVSTVFCLIFNCIIRDG